MTLVIPRFRWTEFRLLLSALLVMLAAHVSWGAARHGSIDRSLLQEAEPGLVIAGLVLAASLGFTLTKFRGDQVILPIVTALAGTGFVMVRRLQPDLVAIRPDLSEISARHALYLTAGLAMLWSAAILPQTLFWLQRYKYTALLASLFLLVVTFVFGTEVNGARLWIQLGPVQAQPSEIVKLTLVVFLAAYLAEKRDLIGSSWRAGILRLPPIPYLTPMVLMWAASLLVLVVLNDLGTALLFFGIFLAMLYAASGRPIYVLSGLLSFAIASWIAYSLFDRIGIRVQNWLDPWQRPLGSGYQPIQAEYALASGGVLGTGLGRGQPWRIPEVHTDFILAAIGEELGLLGAVAVLALYAALVMRGLVIALRARGGFLQLLAVGLASTLGIQAILIAGGVLRVIPLTGITLPFISYGGSSLLTNCLIAGMLLNISATSQRSHRQASLR
ncbi:MAG: cell cycle protein [Thermomicrobiales bacterium]|nr:MAG: cell cycle protein [Thermomicrobiales bacterium]